MNEAYERGKWYEGLVRNIVNGTRVDDQVRYKLGDLITPNRFCLEVKGSVLKADGKSKTGRWKWGDFLGKGSQAKTYDRLILVGDGWEFSKGPFCFYDIPYEWVTEYCQNNRNRTLCSSKRVLECLEMFEVTVSELEIRYIE
jgi:hypothetical protein